jgi:hypothetical protein
MQKVHLPFKAKKAISLGAVWGIVRERNFVEWTDFPPNLDGAWQNQWYRLRHLFALMLLWEAGVEPVDKKKKKFKIAGSGIR